jgi:hypothetical protein
LERFYTEAVVMGLLIGLTVVLLQIWLGSAQFSLRLVGLLVAGGLLCVVQYGLGRVRR